MGVGRKVQVIITERRRDGALGFALGKKGQESYSRALNL